MEFERNVSLLEAIDYYQNKFCKERDNIENESLYFFRMKEFARFKNINWLHEFNRFKVYEFREWLKFCSKKELCDSTIKRHFSLYKAFFSFQFRNGKIDSNPCYNMEFFNIKRVEKMLWKKEELEFFLSSLPVVLRQIVFIIAHTAMGPKDVSRLTWPMIDFESGFIRTKRFKGRAPHEWNIPMSEGVSSLLKSLPQDCDFVFHDKGAQLDAKMISSHLSKKIRKCGLKGRVVYGLRTTLLTQIAWNDGILVASRVAGHRSVRTTETYYVKDKPDELLEAIKMAALPIAL